jgi:colanic acid biosynthesis glycosyl transferase WcaI
LRVVIADYSGHPFQVQLSRELARRGHTVLHLHFADFLTPKGRLAVDRDDSPTLAIEAITLDQPFAKYSLFRRRFQEIEIGKRIAKRVESFMSDVVVGCNLPLDALRVLVRHCRRKSRPFVFWQQDIYSDAIARILTKKLGLAGRLLGIHYKRIERQALLSSSAIVVITEDFISALVDDFGISADAAHVIENWAPLEELTPMPKDNSWARLQGLENAQVVLYSGTLGLKHNVSKLLAVGKALRSRPDAMLVVASEGLSAEWLIAEVEREGIKNVRVLPFQPYEAYPEVLASADVLVALLENDAGGFSVPSKVLSYLCAERAIVLSASPNNLASRIIVKSGGGISVAPDDLQGFSDSIIRLLDDAPARHLAGRKGRQYAEQNFAIGPIAARFESILAAAKEGYQARFG